MGRDVFLLKRHRNKVVTQPEVKKLRSAVTQHHPKKVTNIINRRSKDIEQLRAQIDVMSPQLKLEIKTACICAPLVFPSHSGSHIGLC